MTAVLVGPSQAINGFAGVGIQITAPGNGLMSLTSLEARLLADQMRIWADAADDRNEATGVTEPKSDMDGITEAVGRGMARALGGARTSIMRGANKPDSAGIDDIARGLNAALKDAETPPKRGRKAKKPPTPRQEAAKRKAFNAKRRERRQQHAVDAALQARALADSTNG